MTRHYSVPIFLLPTCFLLIIRTARAQWDAFPLPGSQNFAAKPTITPDLAKYFELDGSVCAFIFTNQVYNFSHARELIDTLIGPRPGGFFPEKPYEIASPMIKPGGF